MLPLRVWECTRCVSLNVLHYMSIVKTGTQMKKSKAVDAQSLKASDSTSRRECDDVDVLCGGNRVSADDICSYLMSHAPAEAYCLQSRGPSVSVAL